MMLLMSFLSHADEKTIGSVADSAPLTPWAERSLRIPAGTLRTANTNRMQGIPALKPFLRGKPTATTNANPGLLAPGIYEARPYTCIVVAPGPHPDEDRIIIGGKGLAGRPADRMPMNIPDLQFIPRKPFR
jgi:hypothetical protein